MEACLIVGLVLLVTVVTALVASSAEAQRWTPPPRWTPPIVPTRPAGYAMPAPPAIQPQWLVYELDQRCAESWPRAVVLPRAETVRCWQIESMRYLVGEIAAGRVKPGSRASGVLYYPEVRYGMTPRYVDGLNAGQPVSICAAGISYRDYSFVSLAQPDRTLPLIAWECVNAQLAYVLDRWDLTDGAAVVGAATNAARAACPAY